MSGTGLAARLAASEVRTEQLQQELSDLRRENHALVAERDELAIRLADVQAAMEAAGLCQAQRESKHAHDIAALQRRVEEAGAEAAEWKALVDSLQAEFRGIVDDASSDLRKHLLNARIREASLSGQLEAEQRMRAQREQALGGAMQSVESLRTELEQTVVEVEDAHRRIAVLESREQELVDRCSALERERAEATAREGDKMHETAARRARLLACIMLRKERQREHLLAHRMLHAWHLDAEASLAQKEVDSRRRTFLHILARQSARASKRVCFVALRQAVRRAHERQSSAQHTKLTKLHASLLLASHMRRISLRRALLRSGWGRWKGAMVAGAVVHALHARAAAAEEAVGLRSRRSERTLARMLSANCFRRWAALVQVHATRRRERAVRTMLLAKMLRHTTEAALDRRLLASFLLWRDAAAKAAKQDHARIGLAVSLWRAFRSGTRRRLHQAWVQMQLFGANRVHAKLAGRLISDSRRCKHVAAAVLIRDWLRHANGFTQRRGFEGLKLNWRRARLRRRLKSGAVLVELCRRRTLLVRCLHGWRHRAADGRLVRVIHDGHRRDLQRGAHLASLALLRWRRAMLRHGVAALSRHARYAAHVDARITVLGRAVCRGALRQCWARWKQALLHIERAVRARDERQRMRRSTLMSTLSMIQLRSRMNDVQILGAAWRSWTGWRARRQRVLQALRHLDLVLTKALLFAQGTAFRTWAQTTIELRGQLDAADRRRSSMQALASHMITVVSRAFRARATRAFHRWRRVAQVQGRLLGALSRLQHLQDRAALRQAMHNIRSARWREATARARLMALARITTTHQSKVQATFFYRLKERTLVSNGERMAKLRPIMERALARWDEVRAAFIHLKDHWRQFRGAHSWAATRRERVFRAAQLLDRLWNRRRVMSLQRRWLRWRAETLVTTNALRTLLSMWRRKTTSHLHRAFHVWYRSAASERETELRQRLFLMRLPPQLRVTCATVMCLNSSRPRLLKLGCFIAWRSTYKRRRQVRHNVIRRLNRVAHEKRASALRVAWSRLQSGRLAVTLERTRRRSVVRDTSWMAIQLWSVLTRLERRKLETSFGTWKVSLQRSRQWKEKERLRRRSKAAGLGVMDAMLRRLQSQRLQHSLLRWHQAVRSQARMEGLAQNLFATLRRHQELDQLRRLHTWRRVVATLNARTSAAHSGLLRLVQLVGASSRLSLLRAVRTWHENALACKRQAENTRLRLGRALRAGRRAARRRAFAMLRQRHKAKVAAAEVLQRAVRHMEHAAHQSLRSALARWGAVARVIRISCSLVALAAKLQHRGVLRSAVARWTARVGHLHEAEAALRVMDTAASRQTGRVSFQAWRSAARGATLRTAEHESGRRLQAGGVQALALAVRAASLNRALLGQSLRSWARGAALQQRGATARRLAARLLCHSYATLRQSWVAEAFAQWRREAEGETRDALRAEERSRLRSRVLYQLERGAEALRSGKLSWAFSRLKMHAVLDIQMEEFSIFARDQRQRAQAAVKLAVALHPARQRLAAMRSAWTSWQLQHVRSVDAVRRLEALQEAHNKEQEHARQLAATVEAMRREHIILAEAAARKEQEWRAVLQANMHLKRERARMEQLLSQTSPRSTTAVRFLHAQQR